MSRRFGFACALVALARFTFASTANDLCPPAADPCTVSTAKTVDSGSTLDFGSRQLDVKPTGSITVTPINNAPPSFTILAGSVRLETGGALLGIEAQGTGPSINITTTGDVRIETGASGDAEINISASENGGAINIMAGGSVYVLGQINAVASATDGGGGIVNVVADGNVTVSGAVNAQGGNGTLNPGFGGEVFFQAGGTASVTGDMRVDGSDGGDIEVDALNGNITASGDFSLNASSTTEGGGGELDMTASQSLTLSGSVDTSSTGDSTNGADDGGDVYLEGTSGSITMSGTIDNHGALPDGGGGAATMTAGLDYTQTGNITGTGNGNNFSAGTNGDGGSFDASEVKRNVSIFGTIDESGGCAGDFTIYGNSISLASTSQMLCNASWPEADVGCGGSLDIQAQTITAAGRMLAAGTNTSSPAGFISMVGCTLGIPSGAIVRTDGVGGENLLQASGQLTIGGTVQSRSAGTNRFEYRDPSKPPLTAGSTIQPSAQIALNSSLAPCVAVAVCGNGITEPGEECDDGNTTSCDGCSATCRHEGCGNGRIECGEECDDGAANGGPGDPCDATCHVVKAANVVFVPASHRAKTGCGLEWVIQETGSGAFPDKTQSCIDGDPTCDADGSTDGVCTFNMSACLNVTDARLPQCHAKNMSYIKVRRPNPLKPNDTADASNADQLVGALENLGVTVRVGTTVLQSGSPSATADHCTSTFVQRVPYVGAVPGRRLLTAKAVDVNGSRSSNRMVLKCLPNPAVCGNGIVEIGEQCDDGNTTNCDGCSSTCKTERCGDGILQCNEQCDDGPNNGTPGDPCTANCTEAPPADRIPGGRSSHACVAEFSLAANHLLTSRDGTPSGRQICVDGDPSCDFDPTPGHCRFHLWGCFGGTDARYACPATSVGSSSLVRPSPTQSGFPAAARTNIATALGRMTFPVGPGEQCTPRMDLDVPVGRTKLVVKLQSLTVGGVRDRDTLKLQCAPAGTVLPGH